MTLIEKKEGRRSEKGRGVEFCFWKDTGIRVSTMPHACKEQHVEKITVDTYTVILFSHFAWRAIFKRNVFQGLQELHRLFFLLCCQEQLRGI